jgi:hypothetical protein
MVVADNWFCLKVIFVSIFTLLVLREVSGAF